MDDKGTGSVGGSGEPEGTEIEDSNPNAAGPQGLRGDMGVSSERSGAQGGIQGTGIRGTSARSTEGKLSTSGDDEDVRAHPQDPAEGPEMDDTQQEATQGWRDEQPAASGKDTADSDDEDTIDRTVGESNTAQVPGQDFDPGRNPGHSHG